MKMKKIYNTECSTYRKFKIPEISYVLEKTWALSIICDERGDNDEKIFKEKQNEILKILGLIRNTKKYQMNI